MRRPGDTINRMALPEFNVLVVVIIILPSLYIKLKTL